ncbi:hypothetical protein B0T24DRAFT_719329 [Lasiosphaeria ovina]|uniref:Uncharacterized protein n=1 Tax=Lasiosphaeria ovina TaxID=92902 RepID=A0AAE0NBA4_9PEZI|nr:hypothetical protein B0T24DRAFT_719329 [Lasiosphaeria ovina]
MLRNERVKTHMNAMDVHIIKTGVNLNPTAYGAAGYTPKPCSLDNWLDMLAVKPPQVQIERMAHPFHAMVLGRQFCGNKLDNWTGAGVAVALDIDLINMIADSRDGENKNSVLEECAVFIGALCDAHEKRHLRTASLIEEGTNRATPPDLSAFNHGSSDKGESGWDLERRMLGGVLQFWRRKPEASDTMLISILTLRTEKPVASAADGRKMGPVYTYQVVKRLYIKEMIWAEEFELPLQFEDGEKTEAELKEHYFPSHSSRQVFGDIPTGSSSSSQTGIPAAAATSPTSAGTPADSSTQGPAGTGPGPGTGTGPAPSSNQP